MNIFKFLLLTFFISNLATSQHKLTENPCSIAHTGTFYKNTSKMQITISRTENKQVDKIFYDNNNFYVYSEIKWLNDCEYQLKMTATTLPSFKYQPGDILNVKINKIEGNIIYFTTSVNDDSWEDNVTKQE